MKIKQRLLRKSIDLLDHFRVVASVSDFHSREKSPEQFKQSNSLSAKRMLVVLCQVDHLARDAKKLRSNGCPSRIIDSKQKSKQQ